MFVKPYTQYKQAKYKKNGQWEPEQIPLAFNISGVAHLRKAPIHTWAIL